MEYEDFRRALITTLEKLDIAPNSCVFVASNISKFGKIRLSKALKLRALHSAIEYYIGKKGSVFVPTATMNLCNSNRVFDRGATPSFEMGAFSEYVRLLKGSVRSMHPFWSVSGIGPAAERLWRVSRHAYGVGSPWSILLEEDARQLNLGIHPSKAVTLIHHVETVIGVPYRYTKEFFHPVNRNGSVALENFYQLVFYRGCDAEKKFELNEHFFSKLERDGHLFKAKNFCGTDFYAFQMSQFYKVAVDFFSDDIYTYLEREPSIKPYRETL